MNELGLLNTVVISMLKISFALPFMLINFAFLFQNPVLCQDTAHVVSMASRSCQVVNQYRHDSSRKHKSSLWQGLPCSPSAGRTGSMNSSTKKNENIHFGSMGKKGNNATPMTKKGVGFTPAAYGRYYHCNSCCFLCLLRINKC